MKKALSVTFEPDDVREALEAAKELGKRIIESKSKKKTKKMRGPSPTEKVGTDIRAANAFVG